MEKHLAVLTRERERLSVKEYVMKQKILRDIFMQADVVSVYLRLKEYLLLRNLCFVDMHNMH